MKDLLSFLGHRLTPLGQWNPQSGQSFNQFREWSYWTGVFASSVPKNQKELEDIYEFTNRENYLKSEVEKLVWDKVFVGNIWGTFDSTGVLIEEGALQILQRPENIKTFKNIRQKLQNIETKHQNPMMLQWQFMTQTQKFEFSSWYEGKYGVEAWNELSKKNGFRMTKTRE